MKERKRNHLSNGGNVFIPQWRMRQIRWEESIANSRIKREDRKAKIIHSTCHCGSIGCIYIPIILDIK